MSSEFIDSNETLVDMVLKLSVKCVDGRLVSLTSPGHSSLVWLVSWFGSSLVGFDDWLESSLELLFECDSLSEIFDIFRFLNSSRQITYFVLYCFFFVLGMTMRGIFFWNKLRKTINHKS